MQWLLLALWSAIILWGTFAHRKWLRPLYAAGLAGAMILQLLLLKADGMLGWEHLLPLHLCSLFGILCIPMLWRSCASFEEAVCFLGAPGAFLTLFFPAVVPCSHPLLIQAAVYQLHVLVALMPLYLHASEKPLPTDPRRTLVMGSGYLVFICLFNRLFGTNYLFLQAAPVGTPLEWLASHGVPLYVCSLAVLCMLVFAALQPVYGYFRK